jgi:hypothetical protein
MSLPALASPSDLAAFLNVAIDDDDARAALLLRLASSLVRQAAGEAWVDSEGDLDNPPDVAVTVCLQSAARAWTNPTAASQSSTGPFQQSYESGIILTPEERELVASLSTSAVSGISSLTLRAGVNPSQLAYGRWTHDDDDVDY